MGLIRKAMEHMGMQLTNEDMARCHGDDPVVVHGPDGGGRVFYMVCDELHVDHFELSGHVTKHVTYDISGRRTETSELVNRKARPYWTGATD